MAESLREKKKKLFPGDTATHVGFGLTFILLLVISILMVTPLPGAPLGSEVVIHGGLALFFMFCASIILMYWGVHFYENKDWEEPDPEPNDKVVKAAIFVAKKMRNGTSFYEVPIKFFRKNGFDGVGVSASCFYDHELKVKKGKIDVSLNRTIVVDITKNKPKNVHLTFNSKTVPIEIVPMWLVEDDRFKKAIRKELADERATLKWHERNIETEAKCAREQLECPSHLVEILENFA